MTNQQLREHLAKNSVTVAYENIDQVSQEEFAKIRMMGLGASDSATILELYPPAFNKSEHDLFIEKATGSFDPSIGIKGSVRKGRLLEPYILQQASILLEMEILKPSDMYQLEGSGLITNFDGVAENLVPVEAKVCTTYGVKNYDWSLFYRRENYLDNGTMEPLTGMELDPVSDELSYSDKAAYFGIPAYYYAQLQQQMLFTGSSFGYLAVLNEKDFLVYIFKVWRDNKLIEELKNKAKILWLKVLARREIIQQNKELK